MLEASKISELTKTVRITFQYSNSLSTVICSPPQTIFFCDCSECPGPTNLQNTLEDVFIHNVIQLETSSDSGFWQTYMN
jgi:hypothetical protein